MQFAIPKNSDATIERHSVTQSDTQKTFGTTTLINWILPSVYFVQVMFTAQIHRVSHMKHMTLHCKNQAVLPVDCDSNVQDLAYVHGQAGGAYNYHSALHRYNTNYL